MLAALLALIAPALASSPLETSLVYKQHGRRSTIDSGLHLGLDMTGFAPGVSARFDLGQRVRAEGRLYAGVPLTDKLSWTGGATLGIQVAPFSFSVGSSGKVDLAVGVGGRMKSLGSARLKGTPFDFGSWVSGTLNYTPDGRFTLYGGVEAQDVLKEDKELVPTAGVRVRLD